MISPDEIRAGKILIADDREENIFLLEEVLTGGGFSSLRWTTQPKEIIPMVREWNPDLILLDLNMPEMDGFEVMSELKRDWKICDTPVMVLTAMQHKEACNKALEQGARDFLSKPFNFDEVIHRITNILEISLLSGKLETQNSILEKEVQERTTELEKTKLDVIQTLGKASEYRDNETGMHIMRLSATAFHLAQSVGMSEKECRLILNTSPMHDLGKIGIPDQILLKPGKLDKSEWETMKLHTIIGHSLLSDGYDSELKKQARTIAVQHHEKWDGSGYPNSLKEEEISIEARIVAISDVFDALISKRPYKEPWPLEKAFDYLDSEKGRHFDPYLVPHFLKLKPKIMETLEKYRDEDEPSPVYGNFADQQ